jgi:hypothetical protein
MNRIHDIRVTTLEPIEIIDRLKKSNYEHKNEVLQLIKAYKNSIENWQRICAMATEKLRKSNAAPCQNSTSA